MSTIATMTSAETNCLGLRPDRALNFLKCSFTGLLITSLIGLSGFGHGFPNDLSLFWRYFPKFAFSACN
jgi:hypothetical protein